MTEQANRTASTSNGTSTNYTTNDLNQYTATSGGDTKSYAYDNNGNLSSDGTKTYKYDYQNRLVEVKRSSDNATIASYVYDLLGRRTKKVDTSRSTNSSETILYTYANENTIAEEKTVRSGTSSIILNKVFINGLGTDNLIAYDTDERTISDYNIGKLSFCDSRVFPYESDFIGYSYTGITTDCSNLLVSSSGTTNNRYYVHTNHQGSVVALTSSTGVVVQQYAYDSFGVPYVKSGTGVNSTYTLVSSYIGSLHENTRLYTSREYDRELDLYFLRARYYSANTGKFISRDPVGQNDQINLYTYVGNSPMMYVDIFGKAAKQFIEAYDNYNALKKKIYNLNGKFDLGFINMDADKQVALLDEYYKARDYAKELHYARNKLNTEGLPTSIEDAKDKNWTQPTLVFSSYAAAIYHQDKNISGAELKFVSPDGHQEVILSQNGNLVTDPRYMGTYNFFKPDGSITERYMHLKYDVDPYNEWGNTEANAIK